VLQNGLFVFVIVVFKLSHFSHGLSQSTYAVLSPLASCDTRYKRTSVTHVIFYLHFILNVSCILTLCRFIVIHFTGEIWRDCIFCVPPISSIVEISFRFFICCVFFVIIRFSSNCNKLSEFSAFVFKYEGGFKISVLLFR